MSVIENQEIGPLTKKLKNHEIQTLKNYNNVKGDE